MPRDGTAREPEHDKDHGRGGGEDDAGRKKAVIALAAVIGLIAISLYIGHVLRQSSALEDCQMQGRTNCAPVDTGR
jgi:hypothetical protein